MTDYKNVPVTVIGASRGLGRAIAERFHLKGARVLAVARGSAGLEALARALPGIHTLVCDASQPSAPEQVFAAQIPRILVLAGGAVPPCAPLPEMNWEDFSANWNADTRMSFNFLRAALTKPLPDGSSVLTVTSGAMLGGSPISGGYAGAKRMQHFLSGYAQREAGRAKLNLRFLTLSPARLMPDTDVGKRGVSSYAVYNGVSEADFIAGLGAPLTPEMAADAVLKLINDAPPGGHFEVSPDGVAALA